MGQADVQPEIGGESPNEKMPGLDNRTRSRVPKHVGDSSSGAQHRYGME
jgi:hypothetical protein